MTDAAPSDEELARQATAGDRDALERLIRHHQGWVYNIAVRMVWRSDRAEDATQEILIKIVTHLGSFEGRSQLRTWAIHNIQAVRPGSDGGWLMDTPRGPGRLRIGPNEHTGVLDHELIDAHEGRWLVPTRVVAVAGSALVMMTFTKPDALPDEAFRQGMRLLEEELETLKRLVESSEQIPDRRNVPHAGQSPGVGGIKRVRIKEGQKAAFESLFGELQARVRESEPGAVYYDLFQSRTDPQDYVVLEKYESREAWEAHQHSAHGKALFPQIRVILEELAVEYFDEQGGV